MRIDSLGAVVIGRNEGERLRRCLESIAPSVEGLVYVDSGSTDDSVKFARSIGAATVELDPSVPFTAARARNVGFERLRAANSGIRFAQFVDGDCEVVPGWLEAGHSALTASPDVAVVCGRRRERSPDASIYNRLCDMEWNTPVGEALACGGDSMMRASAFEAVGGFDASLIAGEEPELCVRLRRAGFRIERIDHEMTRHDAEMKRFGQWWQRTQRSGHAFAEGAALHGKSPERHWVREAGRIWFWGAAVPIVAFGAAAPTDAMSLGLLAGYPISAARAYLAMRRRGYSRRDSVVNAAFTTVGKFAELQGTLRYHLGRLAGRRSALIEYKDAVRAERQSAVR